jgi:hypothetical protein
MVVPGSRAALDQKQRYCTVRDRLRQAMILSPAFARASCERAVQMSLRPTRSAPAPDLCVYAADV